jgi:Predicted membrane protein (DUF2207)
MTPDAGVREVLLLFFLASPIGVAIYMFWLAWTRGGDPEQDSISVQYEPPNNLTPAECGALLDNAVAPRGITATITDLSVKGHLTIEQKENPAPGDHTDYVFHLVKPLTEVGNLKPHEREVLASIFSPTNPLLQLSQSLAKMEVAQRTAGNEALASFTSSVEAKAKETSDLYLKVSGASDAPRNSVSLSDAQNRFFLHLARIRDAIFEGLVADGYYGNRPDRIRMIYAMKGVLLGLLMAVIGAALALVTRTAPLVLILTGLLAGVVVLGFGWFLPARTTTGAQALAKVLGFREFLGRVEKDHIERLEKSPDLFEKYLPYAMALAVENRWTQAFANITVPAPGWYRCKEGGGFLPMHLTGDLNQMSNQAAGLSSSSSASSGDANNFPDTAAS